MPEELKVRIGQIVEEHGYGTPANPETQLISDILALLESECALRVGADTTMWLERCNQSYSRGMEDGMRRVDERVGMAWRAAAGICNEHRETYRSDRAEGNSYSEAAHQAAAVEIRERILSLDPASVTALNARLAEEYKRGVEFGVNLIDHLPPNDADIASGQRLQVELSSAHDKAKDDGSGK